MQHSLLTCLVLGLIAEPLATQAVGTWFRPAPSTEPFVADGITAVYDEHNERVLLYGTAAFPRTDRFWSWDGTTWTNLTATNPPPGVPAREDATMVYAPNRREVLFFGGRTLSATDELWVFDVTQDSWRQVTKRTPWPAARSQHAMAFDRLRECAVMMGGASAGGLPTSDAWELSFDANLAEWAWRRIPGGPSQRRHAAMVYDRTAGQCILFGGDNNWFPNMGVRQDTWTWDGTAWRDITASTAMPEQRFDAAMVFDPSRGRTLLYGGVDGTRRLVTMWEGKFDAAGAFTWQQRSPTNPGSERPIARTNDQFSFGAAFDPSRDRLVLCGNTGNLNCETFILRPSPETRIVSQDGDSRDRFGSAVAVDGSLAIVGATGEGGFDRFGAGYVFERQGRNWLQSAKLVASTPTIRDELGAAVAVSRQRIALGAPNSVNGGGAGRVFIYELQNGQWNETAILAHSGGTSGERFGYSLQMDGNRILVGAPDREPRRRGAAFVFERVQGAWIEVATLTPSDPAEDDQFGFSVALDDDRCLVGARKFGGTSPGAAYVFERQPDNSWLEVAKLTPSDGVAGDLFGTALTLNGRYALIGAPGRDVVRFDSGTVYAFERRMTTWIEVGKLDPGVPTSRARFGEALFADATRAIVGAPEAGVGHVFERDGSRWVLRDSFGPRAPGEFGAAVAFDGERALIGEPAASAQSLSSGLVSAIDLSIPPADPSVIPYGDGAAGSGDVIPTLRGRDAYLGNLSFSADVSGALGGATALYILGANPASIHAGLAGPILVSPDVFLPPVVTTGSGAGTGSASLAIPVVPVRSLLGLQLYLQAFIADPGEPIAQLAMTNAIAVTFAVR